MIFSAGRSSADVALTVKPRPGVFPSSEEIERQHHNQLDPGKSYIILIVFFKFSLNLIS